MPYVSQLSIEEYPIKLPEKELNLKIIGNWKELPLEKKFPYEVLWKADNIRSVTCNTQFIIVS